MYRPFYPGAPRDIDEAARQIHRLLERDVIAQRQSAAYAQVAQSESQTGADTGDPLGGWPATQSPLSSAHIRERAATSAPTEPMAGAMFRTRASTSRPRPPRPSIRRSKAR